MGENDPGPLTVSGAVGWPGPLREGWVCKGCEEEGPVVVVARRSWFSIATFSSSRFRRSLSEARVVEVCSRLLSFCSRSLTCRSLRSRKARWLVGGRWRLARSLEWENEGGEGGDYAARFCAFRLLCAGVRLLFSSLLSRVCWSLSKSSGRASPLAFDTGSGLGSDGGGD